MLILQIVTLSQPLQSGYVESNNSLGDCCGGVGEGREQEGWTQILEWSTGPGLGACRWSRIGLQSARALGSATMTARARESGGRRTAIYESGASDDVIGQSRKHSGEAEAEGEKRSGGGWLQGWAEVKVAEG